jgi:hypothetical protein
MVIWQFAFAFCISHLMRGSAHSSPPGDVLVKLIVVSALILAITGTAAAQRRTTAPQQPTRAASGKTPMKAVGSVKDIMLAITIPTSEAVFSAASEPPTGAAGWEKVQHQALALAESSNLLLMPERSQNRAGWDALAVAQLEAAVKAMQAAEKKDAEALSAASDAVYETCDNCHKKFLPQ